MNFVALQNTGSTRGRCSTSVASPGFGVEGGGISVSFFSLTESKRIRTVAHKIHKHSRIGDRGREDSPHKNNRGKILLGQISCEIRAFC